jgi:uroporphyrinogen-III decarboxylase
LDELATLKRPKILDAELPNMILDTIRYFREATHDQLDIVLTDTQSPNDSASLIISTSEFFAANLVGMEQLAPFMDMLTEVIIEFSEMQLDAMGPTAALPGHIMLSDPNLSGISISDDNIAVISERAYINAALSYNSRLGEHFGGIALHTCGDFHQNYEIVKKVKKLTQVDCHISGADPQPNQSCKLAEAFAGTGITLKVSIGAEEIHWETLDVLIRPDLRLILQVASDGIVGDSNAMYERLKDRCRSILNRKKAQAR